MLQPRPAARAQPQQAQQTQPMARNRDGTLQNPQAFLDSCLSNPAAMAQLTPNLRDAVSSGDIDSVQGVFRQLQREAEQRSMEAQLIRPGEDPMDLEVQVCFFPLIALNTHCGHCCAASCYTCLQLSTGSFWHVSVKVTRQCILIVPCRPGLQNIFGRRMLKRTLKLQWSSTQKSSLK